ncbi:MAG: DUF2500 domain-containing protein [Oscillospiraceae bacterium]|nr:DUF2500 domain-containing protein [Oscillospiraceae bacterium]
MKTITLFLFVLAGGLLIFWLRIFPFREKKTTEPERTAKAQVTARQVTTGADRTGRSSGLGYNYVVAFRLEDGRELELYAHDVEYGALREGMTGALTWKGRYFVSFETEDQP